MYTPYLVKNPDLSVDGGPRHAVAIVVKEDALLLGVPSQRRAQLLHLVHRGVQTLFVTRLKDRTEEEAASVWRSHTRNSGFSSFTETQTFLLSPVHFSDVTKVTLKPFLQVGCYI